MRVVEVKQMFYVYVYACVRNKQRERERELETELTIKETILSTNWTSYKELV